MSNTDSKDNSTIVLENSLQSFFYDQLETLNSRSSTPVPNEAIYYSSIVLDQFQSSKHYFEKNAEGRVQEKLLGIKLMETSNLSRSKQKKVLKEIGDTSLMLCGFFSESMSAKIVDQSYYFNIGKTAYQRLNSHIPEFCEVPDFYSLMSDIFVKMTQMLNIVSTDLWNNADMDSIFIIDPVKTKIS